MERNFLKEKKYTPKEAASLLGLEEKTLANWRSSGTCRIPFLKMGGKVFYLEKELNGYLASQQYPHVAAHKEAKRNGAV